VAINATSTAEVFNMIEILIFIRTFPGLFRHASSIQMVAAPFKAAVPSGSKKTRAQQIWELIDGLNLSLRVAACQEKPNVLYLPGRYCDCHVSEIIRQTMTRFLNCQLD
jgi:hypothetical protein